MKKDGLIETIRVFSAAADQLVHGLAVDSGLVRTICADVDNGHPLIGVPLDSARNYHQSTLAAKLLICRFPKRFSPIAADKLQESSLKAFHSLQKELKFSQRSGHSQFIVNRVRAKLSELIDWDSLCDSLESVTMDEIIFTPGVSFDTDSTLVSKLRSMAINHVEYFYQPFGIPMVSHSECVEPQRFGRGNPLEDYEVHTVRLIAVPKNFKTARVIAPEDVYRQALARRYFVIADRYLPDQVRLHDQTQNQSYALQGSRDGSICTIDLSSASDCVTPTLLAELLPGRFLRILKNVLPTHYLYNDRVYLLHSAATMGNSMTFWIESVVFLGIAEAATEFVSAFQPVHGPISVYGDDIIAPSVAAETLIDWLEALDFRVNVDKSFYDPEHRYRESCGEEYFEGVNVSSLYFPRFPLVGQIGKFSNLARRDAFRGTYIDTMTSMIDLQHKLFNVCVPAALLIAELVREAEPRMTSSSPDEDLNDLWSYESRGVILPAPAGRIENGKVRKVIVEGQERVGHLSPITTYPKDDRPAELLVDLYNYAQFLKFGPRFDTELDRLLGVSAKPISYQEARNKSVIKWALLK
jgi:hypothetical protein